MSEVDNNNEKKNGNQRRNIVLASIIGLAILSLFVFLSNPGLPVPSDDGNNEAEATPSDDNNNQTEDQGLITDQNETNTTVVENNTTIDSGGSDTSGNTSDQNTANVSTANVNTDDSTTDNDATIPETPVTNITTPSSGGHIDNGGSGSGSGNNGGSGSGGGSSSGESNHSPVADDISTSTDEDNSLIIDLISSLSDSDDDSLSISVMTQPEHGELTLNADGTATYVPDLDYFGSDSFTYRANDGSADSNTATVTITIHSVIVIYMDDTSRSYGFELYSGRQLYAEYVTPDSSLVGKKIDTIVLELGKRGSPVGTAEIGVFNSDLSVKKSFGTIDVSTIASTYLLPAEYTFTFPYSEDLYTIEAGDSIGIKFTEGSATDSVIVKVDDDPSDPFDGRNSYRTFYTTTWMNALDGDLWMQLIDSR